MLKEELSWLIILAGIIYSLYLFLQVPYGTFFNGDCGLKALLAKQFSRGKLQFDLIPSEKKWVQRLWRQGLFPYEKPFVFYINHRYFISFPFTFSLITASFYKLFGYRGLYLIPLISTWAIWIIFAFICQALNFNNLHTSLGLISIIFASNLTLYSAMYWEHTLAVALCFAGIIFFFIPQLSLLNIMIAGCLVGLSVWVRSEFFAMVGTLIAVVIITAFYQNNLFAILDNSNNINWNELYSSLQPPLLYLTSILLVVTSFLVVNKIIYGYFLGIHSLLVIEEFSLTKRIEEFKKIIRFLSASLIEYFPTTIFPIFYLLLFGIKISPSMFNINLIVIILILISTIMLFLQYKTQKYSIKQFTKSKLKQWFFPLAGTILWFNVIALDTIEINSNITTIYLICLFFVLGVSLLVDIAPDEETIGGKQWGPRYLLILLPLISLMSIEQLQYFQTFSLTKTYYLSLLIFIIFLGIGIYKNMYLGTIFLNTNNQDIEPAIHFLSNNNDSIFVVSHQHVAQVIDFSLPENTLLFRAEEEKDLLKLAQELLTQDLNKFIYICYPHRVCRPLEEAAEKLYFTQKNQLFQIKLNSLGTYGKYPIYEGMIIEKSLS